MVVLVLAVSAVALASCTDEDGSGSGDTEQAGTVSSSTTATMASLDDQRQDALERIEGLDARLAELESRERAAEVARESAEAKRDETEAALAEVQGEPCGQPSAEPGPGEIVVMLYQTCDQDMVDSDRVLAGLKPVGRAVSADDSPLTAALEALLAGSTTEEAAAGYISFFSAATSGALLSVDISNGIAIVDLDAGTIESLNGVSATTGGSYFRGQLYSTVFANAGVDAAEFSLDGDRVRFCELMELILDCTPITRTEWNRTYAATFDN